GDLARCSGLDKRTGATSRSSDLTSGQPIREAQLPAAAAYQRGPGRRGAASRGVASDRKVPDWTSRNRGLDGPGKHVLYCGEAPGPTREAHVPHIAAEERRNVHHVGRGERGVGDRIRYRLGQGGAVVAQIDLERVAAVQVDAGPGKVDGVVGEAWAQRGVAN